MNREIAQLMDQLARKKAELGTSRACGARFKHLQRLGFDRLDRRGFAALQR